MAVNNTPAGLWYLVCEDISHMIQMLTYNLNPYHKAVAIKVQVEPMYIGLSHTLKGNPVTRSFIKIPK